MKEFMSQEAIAYYKGGRRKMIDGVPCRIAAHGATAGKAFIKQCVAGQVEIDGDNRPDELSRFRFVPANGGEAKNCKPTSRKSYAFKARYKSSWWRAAGLAYAPYEARELTDTPAALEKAKREYHKGNPKPLREYLADTAGERRAYWAAVDAARATEAAAMWKLAA